MLCGLVRESVLLGLARLEQVSGPGDPRLIETRWTRWLRSLGSSPRQPLNTKALHYPLVSPGPCPGAGGDARQPQPLSRGPGSEQTAEDKSPGSHPRSAAKLENCALSGICCGAWFGGQVSVVLRWGDPVGGVIGGRGQQAVTHESLGAGRPIGRRKCLGLAIQRPVWYGDSLQPGVSDPGLGLGPAIKPRHQRCAAVPSDGKS